MTDIRTTDQTTKRPAGSWIAICRTSGELVFETFNTATARKINRDKYDVLPAGEALAQFNAASRA